MEAFIRVYVEGNKDPMKDYETAKEAIELEEQTKAAIRAEYEQMEQMRAMTGSEAKEAKRRRKEEAKRNKEEAKMLRMTRWANK